MTPQHWCYLDFYQGDPTYEPLAVGGRLPLEKVYAFEPVPAELTAEQRRHVLGGQGNVWTEYIPSFRQVQYMTLPRAAALAEVLWSPAESRDLDSFRERLGPLCARYAARGWTYRNPFAGG
jgi:hexosaminidase